MNKDDKLYGLPDWEVLESDLDEALTRILDEFYNGICESFDTIADRISWPLRISVYKRRDIGGEAKANIIAERALDYILDELDDEYSDRDASVTEPTEAMKAAALAFGRAIVADYISYQCESTGEVIEYTREEIEKREKSYSEVITDFVINELDKDS